VLRILDLAVRASGVRAEAGVNDAPLECVSGRTLDGRFAVNHWLMPEGNRLTAFVAPDDSGAPSRVFRLRVVDPDEALPAPCSMRWKLPGSEKFEPFRVSLPFRPPSVPPCRLWGEARAFESLDDLAASGARRAGLDVLDACLRGDVARTMDLLEYRASDMIAAYAEDGTKHRARLRKALESLLGKGGAAPLREDEVLVRTAAGGRVVLLAGPDGVPLVSFAGGGGIPIAVSFVQGRWVVSR